MAGVPINFAVPGESAIASYSWQDIADGSGKTTFYLTNLVNTLGDDLSLITENDGYNFYKYVGAATTGGYDYTFLKVNTNLANYTSIFEKTFKTKALNSPRTLQGVATIKLGVYSYNSNSGYSKVTATLQKEAADTTVTDIASASSVDGVYNQATYCTFTWNITVPTTLIKAGEKILLKLNYYLKKANTSDGAGAFIYNPQNKDVNFTSGSYTVNYTPSTIPQLCSASKIDIPFKIDL